MRRLFSFVSKEPVEEPKSGFVGDLSNSQEKCLNELKEWIVEEKIVDLEVLNFDDHDYLRFCRARNFAIDNVKEMFQTYVTYRAEN